MDGNESIQAGNATFTHIIRDEYSCNECDERVQLSEVLTQMHECCQ